jgi:hypothetical protein
MSFVGIDTALGTIGLFAYEPNQWYRAHRVNSGKLKGPARLVYLRDHVAEWLDSLPNITYAGIEDGAFNAEGRIFQLGGIQHIMQLLLWDRVEAAYVEPAPVQLKKFQTGKPGALKDWMLEAANDFIEKGTSAGVKHILNPDAWPNTKITDDNIADAVGLARIAYALYTEDVKTRAEAEVVHSLQNSKRIHEVP